jgi:hypothetical protein
MACFDFVDEELVYQVGSELVVGQNRVLDVDSLSVEQLTHILLHQGNANMVILGVLQDILKDDFGKQSIRPSKDPINKLPLNIVVSVDSIVILRVGVLEKERNTPSYLPVVKVLEEI